MSAHANPATPSKPRGRRAGIKIPCDECIARASEQNDLDANVELCERCTNVLHQPRRRQAEGVTTQKVVRRQSNAIIDTALGVRTAPVELPWSDEKREQHALEFFIRHSAPQLAGYFDSPFWQRMVMQAARNEPAVKHAVVAIGALHEKILSGALDHLNEFALEQCNKSIRHLIKPAEADNLRLMLTACVLFTCFEALQGNCEQAIIHATQGYNLLQQYATDPENKRWDVGAFAVELHQLCLLMRRLQTQSKGLMGKEYSLVSDESTAINEQRPTYLGDLGEARSCLETVMNQLTVFFVDLELDDRFYDMAVSNAEKHILFSPWLASWEQAFTALLTRRSSHFTSQDRKAAMVLKAHHLVAEILAGVDLALGEMGWDAFHAKFNAIVDLASVVLEGSTEADESVIEARWKTGGAFISAPSATLSFSLGIVDPLYEVCAKCRDPFLRRKALNLLARHPRQECMWSSWSAWKVGKFILRLEEAEAAAFSSSDIAVDSRVSKARLDFTDKSSDRARKGKVAYRAGVPRVTPRYALNPGLFEDRVTEELLHRGTDGPGTLPSRGSSTQPSESSSVAAPSRVSSVTPSFT
ncbi:hypothetical protein B0A50_04432 [Salinomyces thailandicus]|uniref:Zn(2)-C6 fungal-type domain-containing protein n=1 Tax=Salinomyces thailandicus TaxID=706561 RepID=A0A4U0TYJ4_9PEZI|nr:hypothetical protein B0A50_04432 [Salinomyces thailandica]